MLEKRKDDSESIQKFQGMLMAAIIGGLLLFIAPVMVVYITGVDLVDEDGNPLTNADGDPLTAETGIVPVARRVKSAGRIHVKGKLNL